MTDAPPTDSPETSRTRRRATRTLVETVREGLRTEILSGKVKPGDKIASEAQLTERFGVSRTVVREAIASLRADGLVEARQGAGVFVLSFAPPSSQPFENLDVEKISHMIEMLELRSAVEIEAAALAAARRSAAQEEEIMQRLLTVEALTAEGRPAVQADLELHLAIADATNNRRFRDFLQMLGRNMIPRTAVQQTEGEAAPPAYMAQISAEHRAIFDAIAARDEDGAREAMRTHLKGSLQRYRALLRRSESGSHP
ncbi:FadR/GntR family transcriptional regulator [Acidimangrovimonas sediminis]|uniref:FadR/GntR family transcriptional regulator n=1 Tax=Acidimangrovimonas sediminis TaxID=2056283 RepID=UPI000C8002A9|nr:FadR/GntR family transcriptional regulator [Acidimangrovimonas sediminis]